MIRARLACAILCSAAACLAAAAWTGAAGAAGDPYADAADARIPCPAAPPGWFNPPAGQGGRSDLTPDTALENGAFTQLFGAPIVQVSCTYATADGKSIAVQVRYALPIDLNPWNDFDVGCSSTHRPPAASLAPQAWNDRDRVYRVIGARTWSLATFDDDLAQLSRADVPRFEAIADTMLHDAQPLAHGCSLAGNGKPVALSAMWVFSFTATTSHGGLVSSAKTTGSFTTTPSSSGINVGAIENLSAESFVLSVVGKGTRTKTTIRVRSPIAFEHSYGSVLRLSVVVARSDGGACRAGSTGTLELAAPLLGPPSVKLVICGRTYLNGKGLVAVDIKNP